MPPPPPAPPTTPKTTTTTTSASKPSTSAPSTTDSTIPDSTTSESTSSTPSIEVPNPDDGRESAGGADAYEESGEPCSFMDDCLGCLIALIVLDILLILILIILIILARRGSKKMKAAAVIAGGATQPPKPQVLKKSKESEAKTGTVMCEMSGDGAAAKHTEDGTTTNKGKNANVTEDETKYFTVDSEFQAAPSKKKKMGKK